MALVSAQGTTFNLPNYLGELYMLNPADAPFYSMIGGKVATASKDFEWETGDNVTTGTQANLALEGAAPTASVRSRANVSNVCQIHQESFEVTYTKMAAVGQRDGLAILGDQPVTDERTYQAMLKLEKIKLDIEYSFLHGAYAKPADNSTVRSTRGLVTAITTNNVAANATSVTGKTVTASTDLVNSTAHGLVAGDEVEFTAATGGAGITLGQAYFVISSGLTADVFKVSTSLGGATIDITTDGTAVAYQKRNQLSKGHFDKLLRTMVANQARMGDLVIMANSYNKQRISQLYGYAPMDRTVGGLNISVIETDFAKLGIVYNRNLKSDTVLVANIGVCRPRVLPIPGKGFLFSELMAKTKSAEQYQIYGEIGLEYGPEIWHGKITGLTSDEVIV